MAKRYVQQGQVYLLDAMRLLQKVGYQYSLTIAGVGNHAPYLAMLGKLDHVSIKNRILPDAKLLQMLTVHDVLVLPYVETSQSRWQSALFGQHFQLLPPSLGLCQNS